MARLGRGASLGGEGGAAGGATPESDSGSGSNKTIRGGVAGRRRRVEGRQGEAHRIAIGRRHFFRVGETGRGSATVIGETGKGAAKQTKRDRINF